MQSKTRRSAVRAEHDDCLGKAWSPVQVRGGGAPTRTKLKAFVEMLVSRATRAARLWPLSVD